MRQQRDESSQREPVGLGVGVSLALRDGRVLMARPSAGREQLMVRAPGRAAAPLIDTPQLTSPPAATLGDDRIVLVVGNVLPGASRLPRRPTAASCRMSTALTATACRASQDPRTAGGFSMTTTAQSGASAPEADSRCGSTPARRWRSIRTGRFVMIRHDQPNAVRLVRVPIDGGEGVEIPIDGDWRPVPGGLGSQAVGPDGSIISRVASKHSWSGRSGSSIRAAGASRCSTSDRMLGLRAAVGRTTAALSRPSDRSCRRCGGFDRFRRQPRGKTR